MHENSLLKIGFKPSSTMPVTPSDSDCLLHSIIDNLKRLGGWRACLATNPLSIRTAVVSYLPTIDLQFIHWNYSQDATEGQEDSDPKQWMVNMMTINPNTLRRPFCDQIFLTTAVHLFQIDAVIIHSKPPTKFGWIHWYHKIEGKNSIKENLKKKDENRPMIFMEYTGEGKGGQDWSAAHYSSVEPTQNLLLLKHLQGEEVDPPLLKETKSKDLEKILLRKSPNVINDHSTNKNEAWEVVRNTKKVTHDIKNVGVKCHLCSLPLNQIKFKKIQEKHKLIKDIANIKTDITNCQCGEMAHIMCLEDINCIKIPNPKKEVKLV